jgi:deazaflavin-dependent oxidoreductase (nitroreductase family)
MLRIPPRLAYALGLGPLVGRAILLLTTFGRKTGLPRVTPLQYEEIDGLIHIGSARGVDADWYRNIEANPEVEVRVREKRFRGRGETVTDLRRVTDFLEHRLKNRPRFVGMLMRTEGLPPNPTREQMEEYASKRAMVVIHPVVINTHN